MMNLSISLELGIVLIVQFVTIVAFFTSLKERVKRLESDVIKVQNDIEETKEKHELIARIDAKLDMLIRQLNVKQG